jgi:CheY-specific phosphatase CheX
MSDRLLPMIGEVTSEVLETMFFATAAAVECAHDAAAISAIVHFEGEPSGALQVSVSPTLARSIAAGFLGLEPDEVTAEADGQVSCELANMICGAILSRLHPDSQVALDSPRLVASDAASQGKYHQCFESPDGMLGVTMRVQ